MRSLGDYQVLFEFSVGHLVGGHLQVTVGKGDGEDSQQHASSGFLRGLFEGERWAQWLQAGGKVVQRLLVEIGVAVFGEKGAVDLAVGKPVARRKSAIISLPE